MEWVAVGLLGALALVGYLLDKAWFIVPLLCAAAGLLAIALEARLPRASGYGPWRREL